jgi:hypothetical protein
VDAKRQLVESNIPKATFGTVSNISAVSNVVVTPGHFYCNAELNDESSSSSVSTHTIDAFYRIHMSGNIFCVSRRFFGTVDSLSARMWYINEPVAKMVQSTVKTSAYTSGYSHTAALQDALMRAQILHRLQARPISFTT